MSSIYRAGDGKIRTWLLIDLPKWMHSMAAGRPEDSHYVAMAWPSC